MPRPVNHNSAFGRRVRRALAMDEDASSLIFEGGGNSEAFCFNDNCELQFGTGTDRKIDFDGTNFIIWCNDTGDVLQLDQNANGISLNIDSEATTADVINVAAELVTTGTVLDLGALDALTTGIGVNIESGATAITGAGRLLLVNLTGATSTSGIVAEVKTDATDETIGLQLTHAGTGEDLQITNTNGGALGPKIEMYHNVGDSAAADDDVVGRILIAADDEEASSTKRDLCQIDVQWTDATAASYASDLEVYLATGAAQNLCLTMTGGGQLGLDLDSDLSASSAAGQIFDDYDDAMELQRFARIGVDNPTISIETVQQLEAMGIVEANQGNQRGYILKLQPFLRLLCGGIYQNRELIDREIADIRTELLALKAA